MGQTFLRIESWLVLFVCAFPQLLGAETEPRWSWTGTVGTTRTLLGDYSWPYEGSLSASAAFLKAAAQHTSLGAELGYHGIGTAFAGYQCGPEWGTDCPGPMPKRIGLWSLSTIGRWRAGVYRFHPYLIAGLGGYLTAEPVQESRNSFAIRHHLEPGVTAGVGIYGFLPGGIGFEGRWHSVLNGQPERRRSVLNLVSGQVTVNGP